MTNAFDDLTQANEQYRSGFTEPDMPGTPARHVAVVTCMDCRIEPLAALGLARGDANIIRNAGGRVTDDALRSIVLAVNLLGVTRVCVIPHTRCAMAGQTEDEVRAKVADAAGAPVDGWEFLATTDQAAALAADLDKLRACRLLPDGLDIAGFVFDVTTGGLIPAA